MYENMGPRQLIDRVYIISLFSVTLTTLLCIDLLGISLELKTVQNSIILVNLAGLTALYGISRFNDYPTSVPLITTLPFFAAIFALVAVMLVLFRFDYSRPTVFIGSIGYLVAAIYFCLKQAKRTMHYSTLTSVERLQQLVSKGVVFERVDPSSKLDLSTNGIICDLDELENRKDWSQFIAQCALQKIPIYDEESFRENLLGRTKIKRLSSSDFGSLRPNNLTLSLKRLIDIGLVLVAVPFTLPILTITAILIKMDSKGPVMFTQERIGLGGRSFTIYKLRSMSEESDPTRPVDPTDPRLTPLGSILRRYRLDELPQLWNVLIGEMSIVGPRPEQSHYVESYSERVPFYSYRHIIRPGITGWAQVNYGYTSTEDDTHVKLEFDLYYIRNISIWLDILIIFKTIKTVLFTEGAR